MILNPQLLEAWGSQKNLSGDLTDFVRKSKDMVVVLDSELNYLAANETACRILRKSESELLGRNLLELFPQLTASVSHRMLLQTISSGEVMEKALSEGTFTRQGAQYSTNYYPLLKEGKARAVLAVTKMLYYPG